MGATANIEYGEEDKTAPENSWPKALQLRAGTLTQQTDLVCAVCHEAIHIVEKTLVMQHAWLELHKGTYALQMTSLIRSCQGSVSQESRRQ